MTCLPATSPSAARSTQIARREPDSSWSDDRIERLRTLWADDELSASDIARRLGITRNAVLGKIHRLGLSNRRPPAGPRSIVPRPPKVARVRRAKIPSPPSPPKAAPRPELGPGLVARLEDLPAQACHWPVGDPASVAFRFCGRAASRAPYCEDHRQVAYQPGGPRPITGLIRLFVAG